MLEPIQATGYSYAMGTDDQQQKDLLLILRGMACITIFLHSLLLIEIIIEAMTINARRKS